MHKFSLGLGLLTLALATATACGADDEVTSNETADAGPGDTDVATTTDTATPEDGSAPVIENPTLTMVSDEIFVMTCGGGACHLNGEQGGGLSLDNDGGLMARLLAPSVGSLLPQITPGSVEQSYLWHKNEGTHRTDAVGGAGSRMPLGLPPISTEQRALLEAWILAGAPE
jgi:hypothetical protein